MDPGPAVTITLKGGVKSSPPGTAGITPRARQEPEVRPLTSGVPVDVEPPPPIPRPRLLELVSRTLNMVPGVELPSENALVMRSCTFAIFRKSPAMLLSPGEQV